MEPLTIRTTAFLDGLRLRDMEYARGHRYARHAHDEVQISIILRGSLAEDSAGVRRRADCADVVIKPAGTLHANDFDGTRIICIDGPPERIDARAYGWHRCDAVSTAGLRLAARFVRGVSAADDVDELFAAIEPRRCANRVVATRAAESLNERYASHIDVRSIAGELRVHPVYLARVFREQWGCTPREYLQRVRMRAAAERVTSTRQPLAEIAFETGFSDQSHMTRLFTRMAGVAPAALRRLAR